ncbi:MAG: 50S ribosomal protein L18 [Pelagibacteraceae bacterium]
MIRRDQKRTNRVRFKLKKVATDKPRLTVFRSAKNIYAQVIDDSKRVTLASASSVEKNIEKKPKKELSEIVGKLIAERSIKAGCNEVYFDRGKYKYHGRVKQLAESAKSGGLKF